MTCVNNNINKDALLKFNINQHLLRVGCRDVNVDVSTNIIGYPSIICSSSNAIVKRRLRTIQAAINLASVFSILILEVLRAVYFDCQLVFHQVVQEELCHHFQRMMMLVVHKWIPVLLA